MLPPDITDIELARSAAAAPTPMSNYQTPLPQYCENSIGVADDVYEYKWPSVTTGRPISSLMSTSSMSTPPPSYTGNYIGNVFDNGYNGYLQPHDMYSRMPPPYPSVSPPLPPLLDGFTDTLGSHMRSFSASPASSSNSALNDPSDFAFMGHNVPHQYLLFNTT